MWVSHPGQKADGLQEALSVGRVEDPDLQQVLVLHHVAALRGGKPSGVSIA